MDLPIWITPIVAAIAGLFGWLTSRTHKPGSRENALIDQLQEDLSALRTETASLRSELAELKGAQRVTDTKLRVAIDYSHQLRTDIYALGLEPRPWPEGI